MSETTGLSDSQKWLILALVTGTGALVYLLGPVLAPFMASAQAMGCHPSHSDAVKAGLQNFLEKQKPEIAASIAKHGLGGMRTA